MSFRWLQINYFTDFWPSIKWKTLFERKIIFQSLQNSPLKRRTALMFWTLNPICDLMFEAEIFPGILSACSSSLSLSLFQSSSSECLMLAKFRMPMICQWIFIAMYFILAQWRSEYLQYHSTPFNIHSYYAMALAKLQNNLPYQTLYLKLFFFQSGMVAMYGLAKPYHSV